MNLRGRGRTLLLAGMCLVAGLAGRSAPLHAQEGAADDSTAASAEARAAADARLLSSLAGAQVGFLAIDLATRQVIAQHNPDLRFVPASNQKILTTVALLEALGPEHRFTTRLVANGPVRDGVLEGDLVVRPSGDPTFSRRFHPAEGSHAPLADLAAQTAAAGIRRVSGRLVIDALAWDSATVRDTWMVGDLPYGYAATGGVFTVDEGVLEVIVSGRSDAPQADVTVHPARWRPFVRGRVVTVAPTDPTQLRLDLIPSGGWRLSGSIAAERTDTLVRATGDPVFEAARALHDELLGAGVQIDDGVQIAWPGDPRFAACLPAGVPLCAEARVVASLESPALIDIARAILEPSQNWIAEQAIRILGGVPGPWATEADTLVSWRGGLANARRILAGGFGVDSLDLAMRDGSGLSAYNLVTPRTLVQILEGVHTRDWGAAFRDALPSPGEVESTLERRLPALAGRVFAKTGTLTHVNSLSGYLVREDGSEVVFSVLTNASGRSSAEVRAAIDAWVSGLAEVQTPSSNASRVAR